MSEQHHQSDKDPVSGVNTTGHEWDGLKELNNPAPRWWLIVFLITVVWAIGYWVVYPAWPTLSGHTQGLWAWTQFKQLDEQRQEIAARQNTIAPRFDDASLEDIVKDPELQAFARAGGAVAFRNYCAACHGSGGAGGPGYPNLNDDSWIWGGKLDQIYATIAHSIRAHDDPETRQSEMMAFGKDGLLSAQDIGTVADYVLSLSGKNETPLPDAAKTKGAEIFAANCAACHGEAGQGNIDLGAPALNDALWLYADTREAIVAQINKPKHGVMPAWGKRLDERTLKQLTIYVHTLGGGQE